MKTLLRTTLTLAMTLALSAAFAQMTPEKAARSTTDKWTEELGLTPEQAAAFYNSALELNKLRQDPDATQEQKKEALRKHAQNQKKIFTPEQAAKRKEIEQTERDGKAGGRNKGVDATSGATNTNTNNN